MPSALYKLKPLLRYLPSVSKPERPLSLGERLTWTFIVATIYLVFSEIPLYGVSPYIAERLTFLSIIFASRIGTLTTLGIGPIVTAGIILQLLVGSKIINLDLSNPEDRAIFTATEKLLAIIFTVFEAAVYVYGGYFGYVSHREAIIIILQLTLAGIVIILLDETLQKGWGLGSGISLFIMLGIAQRLFWSLFSPLIVADGLPYGVIPALFVAAAQAVSGSFTALSAIVYRPGALPDLVGLAVTIGLILFLSYVNMMKVEIPITVARYGARRATIPLKLLYTNVIPVIFAGALIADLQLFASLLYRWYGTNPIVKALFAVSVENGRVVPEKNTLIYYLTPPPSIEVIVSDMYEALRLVTYSIVFVSLAVLFSILWVELAGMDPESQAEAMVKAGLHMPGFRQAKKIIAQYLAMYIPYLAILSGIIVGVIAVIGNILGAFSTGTGLLLLVGIVEQYYNIVAREQAIETVPIIRRLIKKKRL